MVLHPHKALWCPEQNVLICSDVHIGTGAHFRNNGIPIPKFVNASNLWNLVEVIEQFKPRRIIFLGDLFHSTANSEWDELIDCLDQFPRMQRLLIKGNHEVMTDDHYLNFGFELHDCLTLERVHLTHEQLSDVSQGEFNLSGHLHPAVRLFGLARQSMKIPCFWMSGQCGIMPAFGSFTGTHVIKPKKEDEVYGFVENQVVKLS